MNKFILATNPLWVKSVVLADERQLQVTKETSPFLISLETLRFTIQGHDIDFPNYDIILGLD